MLAGGRRLGLVVIAYQANARAQGYGTDTQNVLTPAAGGMAGVSLAEPQDVPAAIFGNPATLTQFHGTQFTLGGAWAEGYPTVPTTALYDGVPFSVTSRTQGFADPEIGVIQDLRPLGLPGLSARVSPVSAAWVRSIAIWRRPKLPEQRQQRVHGAGH